MQQNWPGIETCYFILYGCPPLLWNIHLLIGTDRPPEDSFKAACDSSLKRVRIQSTLTRNHSERILAHTFNAFQTVRLVSPSIKRDWQPTSACVVGYEGDMPLQAVREFPVIAIQPTDILIVILVALVLFAPTRIPGLVRGAKNMVSEFRKEVGRNDQKNNAAADTPRKLKS